MKVSDKDYWDIEIIKWLYRLSLEYPYMKDEFFVNGLGILAHDVKLYGDIHRDDKLKTEIKSLEVMMRDKTKTFRFSASSPPNRYAKSDGLPMVLNYYFDEFRKELRDDKLNNLLDD